MTRPKACDNNSRGQRPRSARVECDSRLKALHFVHVPPFQGREGVELGVTGGGASPAPGYCGLWPSAKPNEHGIPLRRFVAPSLRRSHEGTA